MTNLVDKSLIVKVCKHHGALTDEEIYHRKCGARGVYKQCIYCRKEMNNIRGSLTTELMEDFKKKRNEDVMRRINDMI